MTRAVATLLTLVVAARGHATEIPRVDVEGAQQPAVERIGSAVQVVESFPESANAWGRYAMVLHAHSFRPEAERAYAEACRLAPGEFRWCYFRGVNLMKVDSAAATEHLGRAVELDPEYAPAFIRYAIALEDVGRDEEARRMLERALRLQPANVSAHVHAGQLELQFGNIERAINHLETALAERSTDATVLSALARAYARRGDVDRAREMAAAARESKPGRLVDDPRFNEVVNEAVILQAFVDRASVYSATGRSDLAVRELERALQIGHDPAIVHHHIAREHLNARRFSKSIESCRSAMAAGSDTAGLHTLLGTGLMYVGQLDEAERAAQEALAQSPTQAQAMWLSGRIAAARGNDVEAVEWWDRALAAKDGPSTRTERAEALSRLGRNDEAIGELEALAAARPHDTAVWLALGEVRVRVGDLDGAVADFDRSLKRASVPLAGRRAVMILITQRRFAEALARLRAMRERWPRNPNLRNDLAWLLATCPEEALRDGSEAVSLIEPVVRQAKRPQPLLLDTLAAALAEAGRTAEAVEVMDEAIGALPAGTPAETRAAFETRRARYAAGDAWRDEPQ